MEMAGRGLGRPCCRSPLRAVSKKTFEGESSSIVLTYGNVGVCRVGFIRRVDVVVLRDVVVLELDYASALKIRHGEVVELAALAVIVSIPCNDQTLVFSRSGDTVVSTLTLTLEVCQPAVLRPKWLHKYLVVGGRVDIREIAF